MIKLDAINRRILYELDKNARIPESVLAKKVGRSRESVRERIRKLRGEGVIQGFITSVNPSKMGFIFFKMYFQLANDPGERAKFHDYLHRLPAFYWLGGSDGVWDLHGTFYAKNFEEFYRLKSTVCAQFKHLILKREIGVLVKVRQHVKKYLAEDVREFPEPAIFAGELVHRELSALELGILDILVRNARTPLLDIARRLGTSVDIVKARIHRLEKDGIIMCYRLAINHSALGYEMYKAFVSFNEWSERDDVRLVEYANRHTRIMYVIRQISAWDLELEIIAQNYGEFRDVMDGLLREFAGLIRNYEFALMREDIWPLLPPTQPLNIPQGSRRQER
jgi:DNA-binding Lrp family transcriptional regulator